MNRKQLALIVGGILLIQLFYFGFDTVQLDKEGSVTGGEAIASGVAWDENLNASMDVLNAEDRESVEQWMESATKGDIVALKQLSSFWVSKGEWSFGGHYMEEIVALDPTKEHTVAAANTYATGSRETESGDKRTYLRQKAVDMYDQAINQWPGDFSLELEKTLFLINAPDSQSPMQGILALVELSKQYPEEPAVFRHLGRFSIQTGQWDKALERLERAYELDPENKETICLLSTVYKEAGDAKRSAEFSAMCENK